MKVLLFGAGGAMGKKVAALQETRDDFEIVASVSQEFVTDEKKKQYACLKEFTGQADVLIDFSFHTAVKQILEYCIRRDLPAVIATTGHTEEEKELIHKEAGMQSGEAKQHGHPDHKHSGCQCNPKKQSRM